MSHSDPQDDETCPKCNGSGKVDCEHSCSECSNGGDCASQDAQEFKNDCPMCNGCGFISGSAARSIRSEQRAEAAEQRRYEDQRDRLPAA